MINMKSRKFFKALTYLIVGFIVAIYILFHLLGSNGVTPPYTDVIESFVYNNIVIPKYDGDVSEIVNDNVPLFTDKEIEDARKKTYEYYGPLDDLGRCSYAMASLNKSLQPNYNRGSISDIYPTGWNQAYYDFLNDNGHLYERCHLIAYMLTGVDGENAKKQYAKRNLITGTENMNSGPYDETGMVQYEYEVFDYINEHPNSNVLYRVTPIFEGNNLLASGVLMEAKSLDDDQIEFCVFCYNVEPNVQIDYRTGDSKTMLSDFQERIIGLLRQIVYN